MRLPLPRRRRSTDGEVEPEPGDGPVDASTLAEHEQEASRGREAEAGEAGDPEPKRRRLRLPRPRLPRRKGALEAEAPAPDEQDPEAEPGPAAEQRPAEQPELEPGEAAGEEPGAEAVEQPTAAAAVEEGPNAIAVRDAGAVLLDALADHVPGAREHADATATYSFATAVELGVSRRQSELIREVARLHEIGKVYVATAIASHRRSELLPGERRELDAHQEQGRSLAIGAGLGDEVADWILHTRERYDGRGPGGLAGRAIPLAARIVRAACAYHEGTRLRRAARWRGEPREAGLAGVRAESGDELDPEVVEALSRVLGRAASRGGGRE